MSCIALSCATLSHCKIHLQTRQGFWDAVVKVTQNPKCAHVLIPLVPLVVGIGAFLFFLVCGVPVRGPLTACGDDEHWLNMTMQLLNPLFTCVALFNLPQRSKRTFDLFGHNLRRVGKPSSELGIDCGGGVMFEHLPWKERLVVLLLLDFNCLFQIANQVTRILYPTYEKSNALPATLWVNVFFGLSLLCGGVAPHYQIKW
jgi:hypothetical protein